ncbi:MAG TPA: flagellar motor protein MotB [Symbiobacteriaceae bacterium]|nr:flagellar motor protein MotB [Symbiobacteriaceae bacterium]
MITLRNRRRTGAGWQASWATLLLCLVVMLGSGGFGSGGKGALASDLTLLRNQLASNLAKVDRSNQVELIEDRGALVIRLSAGLLYESGQVQLRPQALPVLDVIGTTLAATKQRMVVEGHSDSDPMLPNPTIPDNWALSGARANGVLRYLREFHGIDDARLATAGYADTHPVASNETPAGKARNRRVEIRVLAQGT